MFISLENFFLFYYQLKDDTDTIQKNTQYFEDFDKLFTSQIKTFEKELEEINQNKEKTQLSRINLNRFKEVRKLINRESNSHAQYNYETVTYFKKQIEENYMKKTKDGYDSGSFLKKLKSESDAFTKQIDKTVSLMKLQGIQSLFLQLKENKDLKPEKTEFLAPYQRYIKYKKV